MFRGVGEARLNESVSCLLCCGRLCIERAGTSSKAENRSLICQDMMLFWLTPDSSSTVYSAHSDFEMMVLDIIYFVTSPSDHIVNCIESKSLNLDFHCNLKMDKKVTVSLCHSHFGT